MKILINKVKFDKYEFNSQVHLIHECTLDSESEKDARDKSHTTFFEAVKVGFKLNAKL